MSKKVRVRFAPSPTGPLHIGGVRTALFNYLFAKKQGGEFILRIEDTDQNRCVAGAEQYIVNALHWLGLDFDESPENEGNFGPYRQSERKNIYKKYADQLIASGNAYYAFDTSEELNAHRKKHESQGKTFIYNWHNRLKLKNSLVFSEAEVKDKIAAGEEYVIRFKSPKNQTLILNDLVRGEINIDTSVLDDKVLYKSDGMPTYHLANIVDDHLMKITHVIRGEEWLPSLALHYQLYDAFDWEKPQFAHLPLLLKPTGKGKLSKRDGDKLGFPVFPLEWKDPKTQTISSGYKEKGYFAEALVNFLAFLGWNPGTEQELFSLDELITAFNIEKVHKSGARFDLEKINWYNHHYLQKQSETKLANQFKNILIEKNISSSLDLVKIVSLVKERCTFTTDFWEQGDFFFVAPTNYNAKALKKAFKEDTPDILEQISSLLNKELDFSASNISEKIKGWITAQEMGFGKVMMPLRLALVGEMKGPDVFEIAALLGKEETLKRIKRFVSKNKERP